MFLFTGATFIVWFRRAYRNLPSLGWPWRFRPAWAVGAWFVPILSLIRPKQMANDICRSGHSRATGRTDVSPLIRWWWALFLLSSLVSNLVARAWIRAHTLIGLRSSARVDAVASAGTVVAAVLGAVVVFRMSVRQDQVGEAEALPPVETDADRGRLADRPRL